MLFIYHKIYKKRQKLIFSVEIMCLIFTKSRCRYWKYIYFCQSFLALKKRKMMEIWKNKNAKSHKILLFTYPDVGELIKDTFLFLTHRNVPWNTGVNFHTSFLLYVFPVFIRMSPSRLEAPIQTTEAWNLVYGALNQPS